MAIEIGALRALLSLDSAAFDKGAKRAKASMNGLQRSLTQVSEKMRNVGRKMTTRVTLPLAGLATVAVKSSMQTIDAQSKMAQSLGTSTRSMQVLARAGDRAGVSVGEFEQIARQLTKRLSQAATGSGPAVKALDRLGLSAGDLAKLDLDQKIAVINRAIEETVPAAERAAVAAQIFGDRAGLVASRIDSKTIAQAADEIERFGIAVTEVEADQIEAANDAISAIGLVSRGLANQLAVALAPTLKTIAERIADVGAWFNNLSPEMRRFTGIAVAVAAAIGPLAMTLGFVAAGMAALASPIGLAVLAFGAVAGAAAYVVTQWDDLKARFPILEKIGQIGADLKKQWDNLPSIKWALLIPALRWARFIPGLRWAAFVPKISWAIMAGSLKWGSLIAKLSWAGLRVIPVIGWAALAGSLAWNLLVKRIEWDGWIPHVVWADWVPKLDWTGFLQPIDWNYYLNKDREAAQASARATMEAVGRNVTEGLGVGMGSALPNVEGQTRDYLQSIEDAARDETETQSPSRVWMRLGRDLMDGLRVGISDQAQAAAASAAAAAQQVSDAAGAASPALGQLPGQIRNAADETNSLNSRLAGMFSSAAKGAQSFSGFLSNIAGQLGDMLMDRAFQMLFSGGGAAAGGGAKKGLLGLGGFLGFLDRGGNIAPGQFAVVGERRPEIVTGPARVTSGAETARIMQRGGPSEITINAYTDPSVILEIAGPQSADITQNALRAYHREAVPRAMGQRRRG